MFMSIFLAPPVCSAPMKVQNGIRYPGIEAISACKSPHVFWGLNLKKTMVSLKNKH